MLASHNQGKVKEFQTLFQGTSLEVVSLETVTEIVEETGDSYRANARLKAEWVAKATGMPALADDSGVEVDALEGAPGLHSARFVSDVPWENAREILLRLMATSRRRARMRAVLCLFWPHGQVLYAEGVLEGCILGWPRGGRGFGVDPIFSVDGVRSLAEWPDVEKNRISHRGRAVEQLMSQLTSLAAFD